MGARERRCLCGQKGVWVNKSMDRSVEQKLFKLSIHVHLSGLSVNIMNYTVGWSNS